MLRTSARKRTFDIGIAIAIGLSLAATLGAAGCTPQDLEEIFGDVKDAPTQSPGTAVPFQVFSDDTSAISAKETRALIRTSQGYVSLFGHAPPAGVDFSTDWVIYYSAGTKPTGGFDVSIASLTRAGSELVAVTSLVSPGPNCIEPQIVTAPNVLIKFAAQTGASVQFFKNDSVNDCGSNNPCAAVLCPVGSMCVVVAPPCVPGARCPLQGTCVPQNAPGCGGIAGIPCPGAGKCVDDPSDSCDPNNGGADCGGICQCLPIPCPSNAPFNSDPAVCACANIPPPPPPVHCGGIAGIQCPGGGRCVDDPSDGCDPNNGGADCGGICQCVETVSCIIGDVFDSSPGVCTCVPKSCPTVNCTAVCPYGNAPGADGCSTCACNPPPKV
jgi:hypothetical protein